VTGVRGDEDRERVMTTPPYGNQQGGGPGPQYGPPGQPYGQPYGQPTPAYGQPQYGQQQYAPQYGQPYGTPYAAPPQKSRKGLVLALVAVLVLAAVTVLLFLLLSSEVLDRGRVEQDVAQQFQERHGVGITLSCPAEMSVDQGATYDCTGTTELGDEVTLHITITDEDAAAYTWSSEP
jgi:hypothetical protein